MATEAVLDASVIVALYTPEKHSESVRMMINDYSTTRYHNIITCMSIEKFNNIDSIK